MSKYTDVHLAVRAEKWRIFLGWAASWIIGFILMRAVAGLGTAGFIIQVAIVLVMIAFAVVAVRMVRALERRAKAERREVLGDDYPG